MTLQSLNTLLRWPNCLGGLANAPATATEATLSNTAHYVCYVFQAKEDMTLTHVGWRTGAVTGTCTADTRIETVGADGLPTGTLWSTTTNLVSGTLVATTFTLHALTSAASITKGQKFAVVIKANSLGTSFVVGRVTGIRPSSPDNPYMVVNTGTPTKSNIGSSPNVALGSSSTTFYSRFTFPTTGVTNSTFNNTNSAKRGMRFQVPFKCRVAGLSWYSGTSVGDLNVKIEDDSGNELSSSSIVVEGDQAGATAGTSRDELFDNSVTLSPGTWYRAVLEPTSSTNINISTVGLTSSNYRSAWPHGSNALYCTWASNAGSVWVDTATDTLPLMDILIDQLDDGATSGGIFSSVSLEGM